MTTQLIADCKDAELHRIGSVQSYGVLLCIDAESGNIVSCSRNSEDLTGREPDRLLGQHWSILFSGNDMPALFDAAGGTDAVYNVSRKSLAGRSVSLLSHRSGKYVILEIEPVVSEVNFGLNDRINFLKEIAAGDAPEQAAENLLRYVARITDFDRVLLYKFLPGYHGEVIAERKKPGVDGYLGLRFPESDIPANARALYIRNLQRSIVDASQDAVDLATLPGHETPDLSRAQLRAVHPTHIKYLENIGVRSSFSVSILSGEALWGLVACHNSEPKKLGFEHRMLCEELSRILSIRVTDLDAKDYETRRLTIQINLARLLDDLDDDLDDEGELDNLPGGSLARLRSIFRADGAWLRIGQRDFRDGDVPGGEALEVLSEFMSGLDRDDVYDTNLVPQGLSLFPDIVSKASGILFLPFHRTAFIALFRKEQYETVNWAGQPDDILEALSSDQPLTPRSSFASWAQHVKGQSEPWHRAEVDAAREFRGELNEEVERRRLTRRARLDSLTGLFNRQTFLDVVNQMLQDSDKRKATFALLVLDLDKFKPVNDTLGHAAGDALLIEVARRLKRAVRDVDTIARLGGDEFAIIQDETTKEEDAGTLAGRIVRDLGRPFEIQGQQVSIGASVGVALYPIHGSSREELLKAADTALYRVKRSGRNAFEIAPAD
jgi:diguanylate cyclase (GGDEF)-like protein